MRLLVCVFLLFNAACCYAKDDIVMVFGAEYPPYYDEMQSSGMFIEFLDGFRNQYPEYKLRFETLSRRRIDLWISTGKANAFSLATEAFVPESIRENFIASDVIWETSDRLVSNTESPLVFNGLSSLRGARIGTIIGNRYLELERLFDSGEALRVDFYNLKGQFEAVLAKNIDAMVVNQHSIKHYVDLYGYDASRLYISESPLYTFGLSTMVHKDNRGFLNALNSYIRQVKRDGTLADIESRYEFQSAAVSISPGNE